MSNSEGRHDGQQPCQTSSEQQQTDDEENVIRPGEDVIDASRDELFHDGQRALPTTAKVIERRMIFIEDFLMRERTIFINVQEGLMLRVIGKERALNSEHARRCLRVKAQMQRQSLPVRQRLNAQQLQIKHSTIGSQN